MVGLRSKSDIFISIHTPVPVGCSTGTSASIAVALIGALKKLNNVEISPIQIAYEAHRVETEYLHLQSGIQDQISAALGGINFIEMYKYPYGNNISQVELNSKDLTEFEKRLCLFYLGKGHSSSKVHKSVIKKLESNEKLTQLLLKPLRQAAIIAKEALTKVNFIDFGQAATENNEGQRQLNSKLISKNADKIIKIAKEYGSLGAKVNGAGGNGGSVTIICGPDINQKKQMIKAIKLANPKFLFIKTKINKCGLVVH